MKKSLIWVGVLLTLFTACDPNYRVAQSGSEYSGLSSKILIKVAPTNQLVGRNVYAPKIEIYNSDSQNLIVNSVELVVGGEVYHSDPQYKYPQTVPPKSSAVLPVLFKLKTGIRSAFGKQPGELRFRYSGTEPGFAKVILQGQP